VLGVVVVAMVWGFWLEDWRRRLGKVWPLEYFQSAGLAVAGAGRGLGGDTIFGRRVADTLPAGVIPAGRVRRSR